MRDLSWMLAVLFGSGVGACGGGGMASLTSDAGPTLDAPSMTADSGMADAVTTDSRPSELTVVLAGGGTGTVMSSPAGIDCGTACMASFVSDVVLSAVPVAGSVFAGWSDASCSTPTCTVSYASLPVSVTATFEPADAMLSPSSVNFGTVPSGSMTTRTLVLQNNGSAAVPIDSVTLTSTLFTIAPSTTCGTTLAPQATCNYDVMFTAQGYGSVEGTIDVQIAGIHHAAQLLAQEGEYVVVTVSGPGVVTSSPSGIDCGTICTVLALAPISLTATAPPGSIFLGWSVPDCPTTTCQVLPGASITAAFSSAPEFTVGGTVSGLTSAGLVLEDNGGDYLSIDANGAFTFATPVTSTWKYYVSAYQQPQGQGCRVDNFSGTIGTANVTNVIVTCAPHSWTSIATGLWTACGVHSDGTLWCWGIGADPVQIGVATTWTSAAGVADYFNDICALASGTAWCWGDNTYGQLGIGTTGGSSNTPDEIVSLNPWTTLTVGGEAFACGIQSDGTLWCWGYNGDGQLGTGNTVHKSVPTMVGSDTDWSSVSAGDLHVCAIKNNGTLWCWGSNKTGTLGDGTTVTKGVPEQIGTDLWRAINAGAENTCGIKTDGTLWCWGNNRQGAIGGGAPDQSDVPFQIGLSTSWATVSTNITGTCATQTDDSLWCWGADPGDGSFSSPVPVRVGSFTSWASVAKTGYFTCALATDSSVWCWGDFSTDGSGAATVFPDEIPP